jgi:hypothetical protein
VGGLAVLGAVAGEAKTRNSIRKKLARRAANRKCRRQVGPCQETLAQQGVDPGLIVCCEFLRTCNTVGFFECLSG